ncbi:MalY/PatB family protein [Spirochaeta cellobiosiphila]|uniref:MalY/PatB family protein n=1 Tax=Spirochaeta cellobiosiphila TaxID=504483 RepID=UPI000404B764|nr:PatB family C-S lyase [Spirochaeta cellobiosiphila]
MFNDRINTNSAKWDSIVQPGYTLPLWVAEMDFPIDKNIQDALLHRIQHPYFGYSLVPKELNSAIIDWFNKKHGYTLTPEDIIPTSGVVPAIYGAVEAFSDVGNGIIHQPPVYNPIRQASYSRSRKTIKNSLKWNGDHWDIDWKDLEVKLADINNKVMILCNPHNPVGRVWTPNEVQKIVDLCRKNDVILVSDEIHCDLTMPGHSHCSVFSVGGDDISIVLTATGKTFNIPGLNSARAFIKNPVLRNAFDRILPYGYKGHNDPLNEVAAFAAYTQGNDWLRSILNKITENYESLRIFCESHHIPLSPLEGTYLAWLKLGEVTDRSLDKLEDEGGVKLNVGTWFGSEGQGWCRLNLACPDDVLSIALDRIATFIKKV